MDDDEIYSRVIAIIASVYQEDPTTLKPKTRFVEDLLDSLELVEVVVECERLFGLEIPECDTSALTDIESLAGTSIDTWGPIDASTPA